MYRVAGVVCYSSEIILDLRVDGINISVCCSWHDEVMYYSCIACTYIIIECTGLLFSWRAYLRAHSLPGLYMIGHCTVYVINLWKKIKDHGPMDQTSQRVKEWRCHVIVVCNAKWYIGKTEYCREEGVS